MLTRAFSSNGEKLPVIGLGTWPMFDVGETPAERTPLAEVISTFVRLGGRIVDSSAMYGRAEQVIGDLVSRLGVRPALFLATKVWTFGREEGIDSMERSLARLQAQPIDLMQVHNLDDAATHLPTLRAWKEEGRIRYYGITHFHSSGFAQVEGLLRREEMDFLQINYSAGEPEAGKRLLPLAQERGVAVIANRPFGGGDLFRRLRAKAVPAFAAELGCASWAQLLLKWIVANPAITCVIPATSNPLHVADNMRAGFGPLPDENLRYLISARAAGL